MTKFTVTFQHKKGTWEAVFTGSEEEIIRKCVALTDGLQRRDDTKCHLVREGENYVIKIYIDFPMVEAEMSMTLHPVVESAAISGS